MPLDLTMEIPALTELAAKTMSKIKLRAFFIRVELNL